MPAPFTLLVVPCFRERDRLPSFLPALCNALTASGLPVRVRVVDDGSGAEQQAWLENYVRELQSQYPLLDAAQLNPANAGKGGAVYSGWRKAEGADRLAFVDADGAIPPDEVVRLLSIPAAATEAVYAVRTGENDTVVERTLARGIAGKVFRFLVRRMFRFPVPDTQCGFKIVPAAAWQGISAALRETRFCFDVEMTARLLAAGITIHSVPISWRESPGSRLGAGSAWNMFQSLRQLRKTLWNDLAVP